jgi:hypothetical protein
MNDANKEAPYILSSSSFSDINAIIMENKKDNKVVIIFSDY